MTRCAPKRTLACGAALGVALLLVSPSARAQELLDISQIVLAGEGGAMHLVAAGGTQFHLDAGLYPDAFEAPLLEARNMHLVLGGLALARLAPTFVGIGMRMSAENESEEWAAGGGPYLVLGSLYAGSAAVAWTGWARYRHARRNTEGLEQDSPLWRGGTVSLVVLMATAIGTSICAPLSVLTGALSVAASVETASRTERRPPVRVALVPTGPGLMLVGRF